LKDASDDYVSSPIIVTSCFLAVKLTMFIGESQHTLDEKGRIRIPSKHKEKLGVKPYITYGEGCLLIYTNERATKFIEKLQKELEEVEIYDEDKSNLSNFLLNGEFCEEDGQGRILLPPTLIKYAGLTKNLVTISGGNHLQLWDEERLELKRTPKGFSEAIKMLKKD